jgi:hypothetical protein
MLPQANCEEALRQTAEPNFHLSSIELIDAAENGWSREPQLRVPNRVIEALWLFSLAQECAGDGGRVLALKQGSGWSRSTTRPPSTV